MSKKSRAYDVKLRRDVQQIVCLRVDAKTPEEAIDVAESLVAEENWRVEEHIGTHRPDVHVLGTHRPEAHGVRKTKHDR